MWIHLSEEDSRPLYLQVKEQLMRDILNGTLKPGEELPSIRRLAKEARTSVITIKRAYQDLEQEAYIYTQPGKGSFVKTQKDEEIKQRNIEAVENKAAELIRYARRHHLSDEEIKLIINDCLGRGAEKNENNT